MQSTKNLASGLPKAEPKREKRICEITALNTIAAKAFTPHIQIRVQTNNRVKARDEPALGVEAEAEEAAAAAEAAPVDAAAPSAQGSATAAFSPQQRYRSSGT